MPHVGNFPERGCPKPLTVPPSAFVPSVDTQDWIISNVKVQNRAALTEQRFYAPVYLPDRAVVTKLTLYGDRNDAAAVMTLYLIRHDREGASSSMAAVIADWTTGYSSGSDASISFATIDNENYTYNLELVLDPNDNVLDVKYSGALIEWS